MKTFRYRWGESAYTYLHPYWRSSVETKAGQSVTTHVGRWPLTHLTHLSPPELDCGGQTPCFLSFWEICLGSWNLRERFTLPTLPRISPTRDIFQLFSKYPGLCWRSDIRKSRLKMNVIRLLSYQLLGTWGNMCYKMEGGSWVTHSLLALWILPLLHSTVCFHRQAYLILLGLNIAFFTNWRFLTTPS